MDNYGRNNFREGYDDLRKEIEKEKNEREKQALLHKRYMQRQESEDGKEAGKQVFHYLHRLGLPSMREKTWKDEMKHHLVYKFSGISEISFSWMADYMNKPHLMKFISGGIKDGKRDENLIYTWFVGHLQISIGRKIRKQFYLPILDKS